MVLVSSEVDFFLQEVLILAQLKHTLKKLHFLLNEKSCITGFPPFVQHNVGDS